jgi:ribosomal protein S18 acetylase RimI-like enzyme
VENPDALLWTFAVMPEQNPAIDIQLHGPDTAAELAPHVWPCYRDVFGDFDDVATWRDKVFARHVARAGYRLAVAMDGPALTGFSWGYVGQRGQYWTDLVCEALPGCMTDEWVGGHFEFVELAVLPAYRRRGLGRRLHDALLAGISRRSLLSTVDDPQDAAVQLYLSCGWRSLGVLRPGVQVMGLATSQQAV